MPDYSNFSSQEICGISTIFMIFAIGISCLVISVVGFFDEEAFECGRNGKPPLIIWIFGTGIAFTVISVRFLLTYGQNYCRASYLDYRSANISFPSSRFISMKTIPSAHFGGLGLERVVLWQNGYWASQTFLSLFGQSWASSRCSSTSASVETTIQRFGAWHGQPW